MAASKKSTVLGLCLWEGTDKPRRVDFVADNEAIESQLGGHIQNDNLHLNDTRRKRLDTPTEVRTYTGTGAASRTILFGFSPSAVIVFAVDKPFSQATTGCTKQYAGIAADGQNSLGVTLSTAQVTVRQTQTAPTDGSGMASLNESGVTYAVLAFRQGVISFSVRKISYRTKRDISLKKEARSFWRSCALLGVLCAIFRDF